MVLNTSYLAYHPKSLFDWPVGLPKPAAPDTTLYTETVFSFFMNPKVPITIVVLYASFVHYCNMIRETNHNPIALTKTALWRWFVLAHNVGLCVYSAWTCYSMTTAIFTTFTNYEASDHTFLTLYNAFRSGDFKSIIQKKDSFWRSLCDVEHGIWDNGLNYYGFIFYLSKFYEIIDTLIILAKGKKSSVLQTYHHSGAMLSMWSGLRFQSPPIWIFVVFNSLIHSIMYFYYSLTTLKIKVPKFIKASLTTVQICQFIFGGSLAVVHLFIFYLDPNTGGYCSCLDNPGKVFALMFNVVYLAPLTWLFVSFWIDSYLNKMRRSASRLVQKAVEKK